VGLAILELIIENLILRVCLEQRFVKGKEKEKEKEKEKITNVFYVHIKIIYINYFIFPLIFSVEKS